MRQFVKKHQLLIQAILSLFFAVTALIAMIGVPARLVMLVSLAAACITAGINIGLMIRRSRPKKDESQ